MQITKITISRKNEFGEYVVRAYNANGKRMPEADYYTNDKQDAEATAKMMTIVRG